MPEQFVKMQNDEDKAENHGIRQRYRDEDRSSGLRVVVDGAEVAEYQALEDQKSTQTRENGLQSCAYPVQGSGACRQTSILPQLL